MKKILFISLAAFMSLAVMGDAWTDPKTGIEWTYTVSGGGASVGGLWDRTAIDPLTAGAIAIPSAIAGYSVTSIGESAFSCCRGLKSVTIPNSVTSIGGGAFEGCWSLKSVTIPSSVTSIGELAFQYCEGLKSVTIPNSVRSIGGGAFAGCYELTTVTIPNSVTSIEDGVFAECSGLKNVTIPNSVTSIGEGAFAYCEGLTSVTIPSSVTSIGERAFFGCRGLKSVTIPSSVTSIRKGTFQYCEGLTSVTIPNSVTSIGYGAFFYCMGLKCVTIPSSVTSMGEWAFDACNNLTKIFVEKGDTSRIKGLMGGSGFDVTGVSFEETDIKQGETPSSDFDTAHTFNGMVRDTDGVICGIMQITTAKATAKGVKVSGFVMLDDGKKQSIKAVTVPIKDGVVDFTTKVGKFDMTLTVCVDGFSGTLGDMAVKSGDVGEDTGILSGTLKMSYFDAKTGKVKTKSITVSGVAAGGEAAGGLAVKGENGKSFVAEIE